MSLRAAALLLALAAAPSARAQEDTGGIQRLTIIVSSDLDGALAPAACRDGEGDGRSAAHLAASVALAKEEALADGREVPAAIHLGDITGPAALGRFLLSQPDGPERFAALAAGLGFTHAILGNNWLDQRPAALATLAADLPRRGLQLVNANVACAGRLDCDALAAMPPRVTLEAEGTAIAFVGVTGDAVLTTIDPADREGLSVRPFAATLGEQAAEARADGADVVIAATHVPSSTAGLAPLARVLRDVRGLDLLLVNQLGEANDASATLRPAAGPMLAASGTSATSAVRIDLDLERTPGRVRIASLRAERVVATEPAPAIARELALLQAEYCSRLHVPLGARAPRAVSPGEFAAFTLDVMRRAVEAEVALVNDDSVDGSAFPLAGKVTTADVYAALPYDDAIVRAVVTGARLRQLFKAPGVRAGTLRRRLVWAGLAETAGQLFVNERPLEDASRYTLALPDYVARGGDELVSPPLAPAELPPQEREPPGLRDAVLSALRDPDAGTKALAGEVRLDLAREPRWSFSGAVTLAANDTRLRNSTEYKDDARFGRNPASALKGEATGRVDADQRDHSLRLSGRSRYARTSVTAPTGETTTSETEDQIYAEMLYRLKLLRRLADDRSYVPVPYASTSVDSEFALNENAPFRRLEAGATAGVRLIPLRPLEIKLGAGVRRELLDPDGRNRFGVELGYELPRFSPVKLRGLPVDVESGLDYFVSDLAGDTRHEGRLRARLLLPLGGPLSVNAGIDLLAVRLDGRPFALLSDATIGLTARLDGAHQQF